MRCRWFGSIDLRRSVIACQGPETGRRQLGVVLTPAEVQDEGLDRVLDSIAGAGATAISPTLGVYAPARPGQGSREYGSYPVWRRWPPPRTGANRSPICWRRA